MIDRPCQMMDLMKGLCFFYLLWSWQLKSCNGERKKKKTLMFPSVSGWGLQTACLHKDITAWIHYNKWKKEALKRGQFRWFCDENVHAKNTCQVQICLVFDWWNCMLQLVIRHWYFNCAEFRNCENMTRDSYNGVLKEHIALDRSSWSLKSVL